MTFDEAIKLISADVVMINQVTKLLPSEFDTEEAKKFIIEFAEASLEV